MFQKNYTANSRVRGIISAPRAQEDDPRGHILRVVDGLTTSFTEFRARQDQRIQQIEDAFNSQSEIVAAMRMMGGGGGAVHPGAGLRLSGNGLRQINGAVRDDFMNSLRGMPSAGMTSQSGPDGGYAVRPEVDSTIDAMMRDASAMRSVARVVQIVQGDSWQKLVTKAGAKSGWAGEEDARSDTAGPGIGLVTITPGEVYAVPEMTNHILEDSGFDLEAFLTEDVSAEFVLQEGNAFVSGDGIKKPMGFLSYDKLATSDASRQFGKLQYVPSGASGGFASSNPGDALHDLMTALRPIYRAGDGVAWIMNSATANLVRKFKDGQGNYLWSASIAAGQPDRLLGYPIAIDEAMPDVAAGAFPIAFGNWRRGYAIVDKPGLRLIVDRVTKKGWTKMYFSRRTGGGVTDSNAIKLLKISTS